MSWLALSLGALAAAGHIAAVSSSRSPALLPPARTPSPSCPQPALRPSEQPLSSSPHPGLGTHPSGKGLPASSAVPTLAPPPGFAPKPPGAAVAPFPLTLPNRCRRTILFSSPKRRFGWFFFSMPACNGPSRSRHISTVGKAPAPCRAGGREGLLAVAVHCAAFMNEAIYWARPTRCRREPASGTGSFPAGPAARLTRPGFPACRAAVCQDSAPRPPTKKTPRCTRNTHRRGLFPSFPLGIKHLRGQDPTCGPLIPPRRRMGCESIPPADPVHTLGKDGLPVPALCCLFPGSSARRPPRDPPSTTTPGSCRLCAVGKLTAPGRRRVLQRVARGEQHTCREARRRGSAGPRVVSPHPEPGRLADGSGGFYPKNHSKIYDFFLKKKNAIMFKARKESETGPLFARTTGTCSLIRQHPLPRRVPVGVPAVQPPHTPRAPQPASPRPAPPARVPTAGQDPASTRARVPQRTHQPPPPLALPPAACKRCPTCSHGCCPPGPAGCTPAARAGLPAAKHPGTAGSARAEIPRPGRNTPSRQKYPVQQNYPCDRGLQVGAGSEQPPPSHPLAGGGIDRGPPHPQLRGFPGAARSTPGCEARRGQQPLRWV